MAAERGRVEANGIEFEYLERGDGDRIALCLHGFPDDAGTFEPVADRLVDEGFRVVAPYMRGYAPSDPAPDGDYSMAALGADAVALADALDAGDDPVLIGHDWGASACYAAAAIAPERFSHHVAMAVPPTFNPDVREHPVQFLRSWYMLFFQLPALPEWALRADDYGLIEFLWRTWSPGWEYPRERIEAVKDTFRTGDTVENALAYYRGIGAALLGGGGDGDDSSDDEGGNGAGESGGRDDADGIDDGGRSDGVDEGERGDGGNGIRTPTLVVGGAEDRCIGPEQFADAGEAFSGRARVIVVKDAGHFLHQERPDVLCEEILEFVE